MNLELFALWVPNNLETKVDGSRLCVKGLKVGKHALMTATFSSTALHTAVPYAVPRGYQHSFFFRLPGLGVLHVISSSLRLKRKWSLTEPATITLFITLILSLFGRGYAQASKQEHARNSSFGLPRKL